MTVLIGGLIGREGIVAQVAIPSVTKVITIASEIAKARIDCRRWPF